MAVTSVYSPPQYQGNGATVSFAFAYPFFATTDLVINLFDTTANANVTPQPVLNGGGTYDYTISATLDPNTAEFPSGSIVFNNAPLANHRVTVTRNVQAIQGSHFQNNSNFPGPTVEGTVDRFAMVLQQLQAQLTDTLTFPASDPTLTTVLPPAAARANQVLSFDALGNATVSAPPSGGLASAAMQPVIGASTTLLALTAIGALLHGQCRLTFTDATHIKLTPYNGNLIQIAGALYQIPPAGVSALSTSTFINGAGGQPLAASTVYRVYLFNNGGTLALDFSTTGHATDTTAGNVGVEIKAGDVSRTLVGMVHTNASAQFVQSTSDIAVLSWFNRRNLSLSGPGTASATTSSASLVELNAAARASFLSWGDEALSIASAGQGQNNTTGDTVALNWSLDGGATGVTSTATSAAANQSQSIASHNTTTVAEGYHTVSPMGSCNAGTALFNVVMLAIIRG